MKKNIVFSVILVLLAFLLIDLPEAVAQCPMCRMSAESNLQNGGSAGKGLNNGILYMLATPYVLIGLIGYMWWRNRKRDSEPQTFEQDPGSLN